jgi:hypothetical protein
MKVMDAWARAREVASARTAELQDLVLRVHQGPTIQERWAAWERLRPYLPISDRSAKARAKGRNQFYISESGLQLVCPHVVALLQASVGQTLPSHGEIDSIYAYYTQSNDTSRNSRGYDSPGGFGGRPGIHPRPR